MQEAEILQNQENVNVRSLGQCEAKENTWKTQT